MATGETDKLLREMAQVRGFKLVKSRRRKPGGDFGRYGLRDAKTGEERFGIGERGLKASAEDIESFLRGQSKSDWKSSLSSSDVQAPSAKAGRSERREQSPRPSKPRPSGRTKSQDSTTTPEAPVRAAARPRPTKALRRPEPKPEPRSELTLRPATEKDAAGIAALMEQDEVPSARRIASLIEALGSQGKPVIVADEGRIVGAVSYDVITSIQRGGPLGRIVFLATTKPERRRGIGTRLLKEAEARLRKLGCKEFELVHDIELSNANSFLRRHGYQRSAYRFARDRDTD